jgi:DMSO/TMAO reductase YedYZ molybdopterin-dependent catalytic subunit
MHRFGIWTILMLLMIVAGIAGCAAAPVAPEPAAATPSALVAASPTAPAPLATPTVDPAACAPPPIAVPTVPATIPGYTELDPATGLHMTGTVQEIDLQTYRLEVSGKVDRPLSLTYDALRCMARVELSCTLTCPGFFVDQATWAGAPVKDVLALAGVQDGAANVRLHSADGYSIALSLESASADDAFLAYEWEGEPLPILHGFPVRAVFPSLTGGDWVKWLIKIEVY